MEKEEEDRIWIDMDLVIEILSRMPVKSLLKLKCLSKEISRIIHSRNFVDSCLSSCSSNRSRLMFYFHIYEDNTLVFFSAPHRSTSSINPTRHDMTFRGVTGTSVRSPPVRGLIFCTFGPNQHVICNPATKHNISLPQNQMLRKEGLIDLVIFGYDPNFDQYKVLCISGDKTLKPDQYWVLTVGQGGGNIWRKIQGMPPHLYQVTCRHTCGQSGICINGVLYFKAFSKTPSYNHPCITTHVVSFDLNSEEFSLIKTNSHLSWFSKLIDFQGKLAFVSRVKDCTIEFCLLENNEWSSSKVFHLPWAQKYSSFPHRISASVLGICHGEIVFLPPEEFGFTWNLSLEKNTTRKVHFEIPSNRPYHSLVYFFPNHADTTVSL